MIAGAKEDDYEAEEEPSRARAEEQTEASSSKKEAEEAVQEERRVSDIGSISFVSGHLHAAEVEARAEQSRGVVRDRCER